VSTGGGSSFARLLMAARRSGTLVPLVPRHAPDSIAAAYAIQDEVIEALGGRGGWKVGAPNAEAEPVCAPLPKAGIHASGAELPVADFGFTGIEVEIGFRLRRDLLPRTAPYTRDEVLDAVGGLCATIEVVDSRLEDWRSRSRFEQCADLGNHGALIVGPTAGVPAGFDPLQQMAVLHVNERNEAAKRGGNTAGDARRLLHWLANHAAARGLPLRAGDVVTTGSCTGLYDARKGERLKGLLPGVGEVELLLS
jgi:2-keto-4-pentenoate hydratase